MPAQSCPDGRRAHIAGHRGRDFVDSNVHLLRCGKNVEQSGRGAVGEVLEQAAMDCELLLHDAQGGRIVDSAAEIIVEQGGIAYLGSNSKVNFKP